MDILDNRGICKEPKINEGEEEDEGEVESDEMLDLVRTYYQCYYLIYIP